MDHVLDSELQNLTAAKLIGYADAIANNNGNTNDNNNNSISR